jgi:hypothetical protein
MFMEANASRPRLVARLFSGGIPGTREKGEKMVDATNPVALVVAVCPVP